MYTTLEIYIYIYNTGDIYDTLEIFITHWRYL